MFDSTDIAHPILALVLLFAVALFAVGSASCQQQNVCAAQPACPSDSKRVESCPSEAECFTVSTCGSTITCAETDDAGTTPPDSSTADTLSTTDARARDGNATDGSGDDGSTTDADADRTDGSDPDESGPVHYGGDHPAREGGGWERPESMIWTEIGGGAGYGMKICEAPTSATLASSKDQLLSALAEVESGETVWVPGSAEIDLTGEFNVEIPAGVTLASDRGCDGSDGALLLHTTAERAEPMLLLGEEARVTGFEIRGYAYSKRDQSYTPAPRDETLGYGIQLAGDGAEIDNNHVTSFVGKCITTGGASNAWIHHNRIDWCHRLGYGYGVSMGSTSNALIEFNRIDNTRHAIAAAGSENCFYEARYNVAGPYRQNHTFDMHGSGGVGGKRMLVHHNTFLGRYSYESGGNCTGGQPYVDVREVPDEPLQIENNWMVDQIEEYAISVEGDKYDAVDNHIDSSEPDCEIGAPRRGCPQFAPPGEPPSDPEYDGYRSFEYNVVTGPDDGDPCLEPPTP